MYLPFVYASTVKHPRQRFVWRSVVQEDGMFWLLATIFVASHAVWHAVATLLFLVSFWCIYELGYIENDQAAANFEGEMGRVPEGYADQDLPARPAWLWAVFLGAAGSAVLSAGGLLTPGLWPWAGQTLIWFTVLVATRVIFGFYNRLTPSSRPFIYPILQTCRSFAVLAFSATNVVGVMILISHTLARALPYYLYRLISRVENQRRTRWPAIPVFLLRLLLFVFLLGAVGAGLRDPYIVLEAQSLVILAWCLVRARHELLSAVRGIELLR